MNKRKPTYKTINLKNIERCAAVKKYGADIWPEAYERFDCDINHEDHSVYLEGILNFLRWGISAFKYGKFYTVFMEDNSWLVKDGKFHQINLHTTNNAQKLKFSKGVLEHAVVIPTTQRTSKTRNWEHIILINGDDDASGHEYLDSELCPFENEMPTVSFSILARLTNPDIRNDLVMGAKDTEEIIELLALGQVELVDYVTDETRALTDDDWAFINKLHTHKRDMPLHKVREEIPVRYRGFTLIKNGKNFKWHRSGTCVFFDHRTGTTYLIGQDEGTYFGCELVGHPRTIEKAFESLKPEAVRKFKQEDKRVVQRQGEWFMVPVSAKDVPRLLNIIATVEAASNNWFVLPVETRESNPHFVKADDVVIGKDGLLYVNSPTMVHDEHDDIKEYGWHTFHRNTAVLSLSQAGVD